MKKFFLFTVFVCSSLSLFAKEYIPGLRGKTRGELEAYMSLNNLDYDGGEFSLVSKEKDLTICGERVEVLVYSYHIFNEDMKDTLSFEFIKINTSEFKDWTPEDNLKVAREYIKRIQNTYMLDLKKSSFSSKDYIEKYYGGKWEFEIQNGYVKILFDY